MEVQCGVRFGQARPELFDVELFYMYDNNKTYKILPMELASRQNGDVFYRHCLAIEGYGGQGLNVRIKPANAIVQDIHPELIKWKN